MSKVYRRVVGRAAVMAAVALLGSLFLSHSAVASTPSPPPGASPSYMFVKTIVDPAQVPPGLTYRFTIKSQNYPSLVWEVCDSSTARYIYLQAAGDCGSLTAQGQTWGWASVTRVCCNLAHEEVCQYHSGFLEETLWWDSAGSPWAFSPAVGDSPGGGCASGTANAIVDHTFFVYEIELDWGLDDIWVTL